jgi:lysophospholipase L1-like esterase
VGALAVNEALFRARFFGTDALVHPLRYSPAPDTVLPGFIRESDDSVRGFELTPGFEGFWDGKAYTVNSWGYREREFTNRPAPGVFRIVVLGDSYSMASSVAVEEGLSRVMERELNALGHRVEVLNLSVTGYDLPQMQRVLETDVVALHPHLVVLAQFNWVIGERMPGKLPDWTAMVAEAQTRLARQNLIHSYAYIRTFPPHSGMIRRGLGRVFRRVGIDLFQTDLGAGDGELALPIFFDRVAELGEAHGFRGMMLVMHPMMFEASRLPAYERDRAAIRALCDDRGIVFTDAIDAFDGEVRVNDFLIYAGNNHPNAAGHAATAREIVRQMVDIPGLLPDRN